MKGKFTFRQVQKKLPNGLTVTMPLVDHPGAVLIVPFLSTRRIVILNQYRATLGKSIFELPCGTLDPQETPLKCAKRELIEETGYQAATWKKLGNLYPAPGYTNEIIHVYQAHDLSAASAEADDDEIIETKIVSRPEILALIQTGRLSDSKSIAALVQCGWFK